jgi:hypothetical protein
LENFGSGNGQLDIDIDGDGVMTSADMAISLTNFTGALHNSNFLLSP